MYNVKIDGVSSKEFGLYVKTKSYPLIAKKRVKKEYLMGVDGSIDFFEGYGDKKIKLKFAYVEEANLLKRRQMTRKIAKWLNGGELIFDYEADKLFVINLENAVDIDILERDEFDIVFNAKPFQYSVFKNGPKAIDDINIPIHSLDCPMNMEEPRYSVENGSEIRVPHYGTHNTLPIIVLTGVANEIIVSKNDSFFSFVNLDGQVFVDCENKVVYAVDGDNKINKRMYFDGKYVELTPGNNDFNISGTIDNLEIFFDFRNAYL